MLRALRWAHTHSPISQASSSSLRFMARLPTHRDLPPAEPLLGPLLLLLLLLPPCGQEGGAVVLAPGGRAREYSIFMGAAVTPAVGPWAVLLLLRTLATKEARGDCHTGQGER